MIKRHEHAGTDAKISLAVLILALAGMVQAAGSGAKMADVKTEKVKHVENPTEADIFRIIAFAEPMVPVGSKPSQAENRALHSALQAFLARTRNEDVSVLVRFLQDYPSSPWRPSLEANLGTIYYLSGYFSLALSSWESAWNLCRVQSGANAQAVGDFAIGELLKMKSRLGRFEELEHHFQQLEGREVRGPATERIAGAREGLWLMRNKPEDAFRCGPMALGRILETKGRLDRSAQERIAKSRSTSEGMSLVQVKNLARELSMDLQMAKRSSGSEIIVPAVVHWKVGHYSAITGIQNGLYHIEDPTFRDDLWLSPEALNSEASGFYLVPAGRLPSGWRITNPHEAKKIWGKGNTGSSDENASRPDDAKAGGDPGCERGMPTYSFHAMLVSLNIVDIPLGYDPPRGFPVNFRITYNQREAKQPTIFTYSNLGPKWTYDWMSYITDNPGNLSGNADLYVQGGGTEPYSGYNAGTQSYAPQMTSRAILVRTSSSPIAYERRLPDGSREVFGLSNGATAFPRKVFLTQVVDKSGNSLTFSYDAALRLISVTDALGQVTGLSYELATDSLKITKVTDPFGRQATLGYNGSGQLISVTDMIGMQSQFTYGSSDFITSMSTPYGTTAFTSYQSGVSRRLDARDPLGQTERLEYRHNVPGIGAESAVPAGMSTTNNTAWITSRNSFFWDKKNLAMNQGNYRKAKIFHWVHALDANATGHLLASERNPLEGRIWYNYPNQYSPEYTTSTMMGSPSAIGRVLDDGTTQLTLMEYNAAGKVTKVTDPIGRVTHFSYAANLIDLISVRQKRGAGSDLIDSITYDSLHRPLTIRDASGQVTTFTYNGFGQLLTSTNARGETTTRAYDSLGYLVKITGPVAGDTLVFTYDGFGRVRNVTDRNGYKTRNEYDSLDRLTKIFYPDSTYEEFVYNKLDLEGKRDRRGKWSKTYFNANRRQVAHQDASGRATHFEWCGCGEIESLTDPMGRVTQWKRDAQGRVVEKTYPDGKKYAYAYESSASRLKSTTDPKAQIKNYLYFKDGNLKQISYANAQYPTPSVSFQYDSTYNRMISIADGIGATSFGYNGVAIPPVLGAGRLSLIDGPLPNDSIRFVYDSLGRVISTSIQGIKDSVAYDNMGRLVFEVNSLGAFQYKYAGASERLDSLLYPNGQRTAFSYFDAGGDLRLREIKHLNPVNAQISKSAYSYDPEGQIQTWLQQGDSSIAQVHYLKYDPVDQLLSDVVKSAYNGSVLKQFAYSYDKSGNRLSNQEDSAVNSYSYNELNQLSTQQAGGQVRFQGRLNEAGTLTLDGNASQVGKDSVFDAMVAVNPGMDTVTLAAMDYANNVTTNRYQVSTSGSNHSFTFDSCGNMTGDGVRTYEWDAENRLIAVNNGLLRSEFSYDGMGRRVKIRELNNGSPVSQITFLWISNTLAEERDSSGGIVTKRYFHHGVVDSGARYYYSKDHLGSIREMSDSLGTVVARYSYGPFGTRTKVSGWVNSDFGFTGHYLHEPSNLHLTKYRAYSSQLGRWISRDPIEELGRRSLSGHAIAPPEAFDLEDDSMEEYEQIIGRLNPLFRSKEPGLYGYVGNDPVNFVDVLGLDAEHTKNKSKSKKDKHDKGQAKKKKQQEAKEARQKGKGPGGKKFKGWRSFPLLFPPCLIFPELCFPPPPSCPT